MPNANRGTSIFLPGASPDTMNVSLSSPPVPGAFTPYAPGDIGITDEYQDKAYTIVIVDSGATAATPTGTVLKNQLLFWKDKANRIVTNDRRMALGNSVANASANFVAGVARVSVGTPGTGGNQIAMLVRGYNIPVNSGSNTLTVGEIATADLDANGPQAVGVAVGTGPGYQSIGVVRANNANNLTNIDVDIPILP